MMVVVGSSRDNLARTGEDVHFHDGLVRAAIAKRRRFDAHAGDGTAQGDGAQLRNAEGYQSVRQGGCHQVFVRGHSEHVGGRRDLSRPGLVSIDGAIDADDAVECRHIQSGGGR